MWLALLAGLVTNLVTDEFPAFLEPLRPWLLPLWLVLGGLMTLVELRKRGRSGLDATDGGERDRVGALRRIRARVGELLEDDLGGVQPLVLAIDGADSLVAAYDAEESLLVLGAAGSGKSTELWRLADLLARRADGGDPVPLPLPLAGWGRRPRRPRPVDVLLRRRRDDEPQALLDWLLERTYALYRVPPEVTREWLRARRAVLLLDGLDEVRADLRTRCVRELNDVVDSGAKPFVVVSCRTAAYHDLPQALLLRKTVTIAPLTPAEVERHLDVPLDDDLRQVVDTPLWLRVARTVSARPAGPGELGRRLLDAYVTELVDRRGGDRSQVLRRLALLTRLARDTADPDGVDPRELTRPGAPASAEVATVLRAWVLPTALSGALLTGLVLPLVARFHVGVLAVLFATGAAVVLGWMSQPERYAVDLVADRWWRKALGVVAGLVLGCAVGGVCAVLAGVLGALPDVGRTLALGGVLGVAVLAARGPAKLGTALAVTVGAALVLWWFDLTDPELQRVVLVSMIGMIGATAVALLPDDSHVLDARRKWRTSRSGVALTAGLGLGVVLAVRPGEHRLGDEFTALVLAVPGSVLTLPAGALLGFLLGPLVRRAALVWTGLLPLRLRAFLHECARRGLVSPSGRGFRFPHPLVRDHVAGIDVLDGVPPFAPDTASPPVRPRRPRSGLWIEPRLLLEGSDEPVRIADVFPTGRVAVVGRVGSGTSTLLSEFADESRERTLLVDLSTMPARIEPVDGVRRPFTRWLVRQQGVPAATVLGWLAERRVVILLDGHGQGPHAVRNAGMVEEFLAAYDVPAVIAGWADGPPLPAGTTKLTVAPLTRAEAEAALAGRPAALRLAADHWSALDTVDRVRRVAEAVSRESYVDERFTGFPRAARLWYSGLTSKVGWLVHEALRTAVLLPAAMTATTLAFGLPWAAAVLAGAVATPLRRPPLIGVLARLTGLVVGIAAGFGLWAVARGIALAFTESGDSPTTATAAALGVVLVAAMAVREWPLFAYAVTLYVMFDGQPRFGTVFELALGLVMGGVVGAAAKSLADLQLLAMTPPAELWAGVRPWRRKPFVQALIARRVVAHRPPFLLDPADPIVDRLIEEEWLPVNRQGGTP